MRLAPSLHRLGEAIVSCYLLEEAGEVTIIDAGVPAYYADLTAELAAMGRTIEDVRALVLTHGHDDHIGFAERLRIERDVPVSIHELDAPSRAVRSATRAPAWASAGFVPCCTTCCGSRDTAGCGPRR